MEVPKPQRKRFKPKRKKRGTFSAETKQRVYANQNGLCFLCNAAGGEFHHCRFKSKLGRGVYTNCLLLCHKCHREVHQNRKLADSLREHMRDLHGADYYKDDWD